jgi:LuxR family transcriptional regulator, positive regulator of biofilm formation
MKQRGVTKMNCDECCHNGRVVNIVTKKTFLGEQMAFFLEKQTGAHCIHYSSLQELSENINERNEKAPLVFLEANQEYIKKNNKLCSDVAKLATRHHLLAIFNAPQSVPFEKDALSCGIRGIFHEEDPAQDLIKGTCAIFKGEIWVSRKIMSECWLEASFSATKSQPTDNCTNCTLTTRQKTILSLISVGASNQHIADKLCISLHTVKTHIYNIFKKIKVPSRTQAAFWATKNL